jgi:ABC-type multidrug transport system fused ATPase/permease subunit
MSESQKFVVDEKISEKGGLVDLNWRLFRELSLFKKLFPLTVITIFLGSIAPSFYRWYSAKVAVGSLPLPLFSEATVVGSWVSGTTFFDSSLPFSLEGLIWLTAAATFFRIAAWAFFEISGMWASGKIHDDMIKGLTRTRTTFFDENPSGRILNRLVRDFDEVRSTGIIFVGDLFNATIEILCVLVIAAFASPFTIVLGLPLFASFYVIQGYRARHLDRARSEAAVATSLVLSRQTDLIEGRSVFLLYGKSDELLRRMTESLRRYLKTSFAATRVELLASFLIRSSAEVFSFIVILFLIYSLKSETMSLAFAGVILSALFGITGSIGWLDFATGHVTASLPHLRRVFEFTDLPPEEQEEGDARWMSSSRETGAAVSPSGLARKIDFRNLTISYRQDTPIILDRLNLSFELGHKIALVGRTGSGKTSLVQTLLRMVYVHEGDVQIGGQSIYAEDLSRLRGMFGVVPQSPYLFEGTLRSNLDRNEERTDAELLAALEKVGLSQLTLETTVEEGGRNFSLGERQLLCLARVLSAGRKIILMDEPTSGLDPVTDARLSRVLRTAFLDCTVLTIAHRRESLLFYDRVIELEAGKVIWDGLPAEWLKRSGAAEAE